MFCRSLCRRSVSSFLQSNSKRATILAIAAAFLVTIPCFAQDAPPANPEPNQEPNPQVAEIGKTTVTIPAGTRIALVLTQPVQSRNSRRGDDVYAQVIAPVNSGNQVVIPPGTFAQGVIDKVDRKSGRAELRLQSMSVTFPDGYVVPVSGPMTIESTQGYAIQDPGPHRFASAILLPIAGVGLGALIGHSVGTASSNLATPFPPGCTGPPPFCTTTTTYNPGSKGKDTAIGASIGGVGGMIASISLLASTKHFFLDVGTPVEVTLQQPITLQQNEVAAAVHESEQHPVAQQPVMPRPLPPPPDTTDHGTCYTPGSPGTPATVIPGVPGPDGVPGPPTIVPGTPPTPGTPYPCP